MAILYDSSSKVNPIECCRPPSKYSEKNRDGYWWASYPKHSVWQCDECGKHYVSGGVEGAEEWKIVRFYHFKALSIINKDKRKEIL